MMRREVAYVCAALASTAVWACSDPECQDDEKKIGKSCVPYRGADSGRAATDSSMPRGGESPEGLRRDSGLRQDTGPEGPITVQADGESESSGDTSNSQPDAAAPRCVPKPETCDGKDNDCDEQIDEDAEDPAHRIGTSCSNGGRGACDLPGSYTCTGGMIVCSAPAAMPSPEVCDGQDNDCVDGVDNGFMTGTPCTVGKGECAVKGTIQCNKSRTAECSAVAKAPTAEVCDHKDNDCDEVIDNGPAEVCDGVDNDCDGKIDEGFFDNLAADPGFELQSASIVRPWLNFKGAVPNSDPHSGSKAMTVVINRQTATAIASWNDVYQTLPVEPNTKYRVDAWVKTSPNLVYGRVGARGNPDWQTEIGEGGWGYVFGTLPSYSFISTTFTTGSTATKADVYIGGQMNGEAETTLTVDDVSVVRQGACQ